MMVLAISSSEHTCSLQLRRTHLAQHSVTICNHKNSAYYKSSNKMLSSKFYHSIFKKKDFCLKTESFFNSHG